MKILVIGGGGREHALAWKLAQSPNVEVFATPGNPGIATVAHCLSSEQAEELRPELTVVGPEAPLVEGIVDRYRARGLRIVGPDRAAAQLEGSKVYAKNFFAENRIPTAEYVVVDGAEQARAALDRFGFPVVLKADGLAAGKGVVIAHHREEAETALRALHGKLVIEEFLTGEEVSFIALCDGRDVVPLAPTQDHKTVFDGDQGPNTGGMGAYCDSRILTEAQTREVLERVIQPTVERTRFTGFLYAGLMMTAAGPKVLEFNVRLGDPETQPLMHRMESDFVPALMAAAEGRLAGTRLAWKSGPSVCVVLASGGYPGAFPTGQPISGIPEAEATGATVFQAGTRLGSSGLETAGGRVLGVTASALDLAGAIDGAYAAVEQIHFPGMHYRRDIGDKGLRRYDEIQAEAVETDPNANPTILRAIEHRRLLQFCYKGRERIVEPHDYGIQNGSIKLLAYQVGGSSGGRLPNWRWMEQEQISEIKLLDRTFPGGRPSESSKHHTWERLFIRVKPADVAGS